MKYIFRTNFFPILLLALLCFRICSGTAFCSEVCYIDNQPVLLYKIMNWWYDCLPEECDLFCGKTVKCANRGNVRIEYDEERMTLKLRTEGGFAELLSISEKCDLRCISQNEKYLRNANAAIVSDPNEIVFRDVDKKQAGIIRDMRENISFVTEGMIRGLRNDGKIALHGNGVFLRNCPKNNAEQNDDSPITLDILNAKTSEIIAKYRMKRNK